MIDFITYVVRELKSKRLSKTDALALIKQFSLHSPTTSGSSVLHPLLHSNTSDLSEQSYTSTFYGDEFFLKDHKVKGQKVLPGVAYLEMARAAVERAMPVQQGSTIIELRNVIWAQPIVVSEPQEVIIALFANEETQNGYIDFEIYSIKEDAEGAKETVHCQGQAVSISKPAPVKLDPGNLKEQLQRGQLTSSGIYTAYSQLGLNYGPAHQGITTIYQGDRQLLAELDLSKVAEPGWDKYILHPGLMDSAVQSAIGFFHDLDQIPNRPSLPFALEAVRIFSACSKKMYAWVRYSPGNESNDRVTKLDIDLCDQDGKVCVQMQGFTSRELRTNASGDQEEKMGALLAAPVWQATQEVQSDRNKPVYAQQHIMLCEMPNIDLKEFQALVPGRSCSLVKTATEKNIAERYSEVAKGCFESIRKILKRKPEGKTLVQIVVTYDRQETFFAGLSGMINTATLENPQLIGQIILVESQIAASELAEKLQYDQTRPHDTLIKYEKDVRNVLRWQPIADTEAQPVIPFKERGVYVITGGAGGLGQLFAKEILHRTGNARIILTGRSAWKDLNGKASVLAELRTNNDAVEYRQLNIDDLAQVKQFMASVIQEYGQINGILHSAGMVADNYILKKGNAEFDQVLKPKVTGTFNLDQACQHIDLDFFVLFSSVASSFGNIGQADYAAANGFMNQFAEYCNSLVSAKQRHGKTLAIHWPLWMEGGMSPDRTTQELLRQATGMHPMRTATGMQAFYRALELPHTQILVLEGDLQRLQTLLDGAKMNSGSLVEEQVSIVEEKADTTAKPGSLAEMTREYLRKEFSVVLKLPSHRIDVQQPLEKYGIDSILALTLTNQLEKTFGSLPKTLFFEYQTLHELAEYFVKSHSETLKARISNDNRDNQPQLVEEVPKSVPQINTRQRSVRRFARQRHIEAASSDTFHADPIAIVGMSGRYPEAEDIQSYWHNLRDGKDCIIEVPGERWDWRDYYTEDRNRNGHHYSKWGGFISGVDEFDPRFFNISPREAEFIDPQERLFLQHAWMAVEDAGYSRAGLQIPRENELTGQVGVYAGVMYSEYQLFGIEASMRGNRMSVPGSYASIANRVSYALNLHGPSMTLDTMCSSSLSAIHLACQDLKLGRTDMAIAGGVNVSIHPNKYLFLSAGQFISADGHCQSFGEGGDGYIPGEGVGVVVLKRLSEAVRDRDHIYGIIKGSSLNHGGKTNGYSVPNPRAQAALISQVLEESKTNPRHISYIEAHGTGTKLGDPIEIAALTQAFQRHTPDTGYCLIGSAKSNIGHAESAAGIAGLTKVLMQMKYRQITPSLHSAVLNPYIDFQKTPFVVNQTLKAWDPPVIDGLQVPRIAGISAFGAGGSNAHLIIEEYTPQTEVNRPAIVIDPADKIIIPLSARNADQLKQKAIDLLDFIGTNQPDLVAMAYTLQVGREAMEERVGFIVNTIDGLVEKLQAWIHGEHDIESVFQGNMNQNRSLLSLMNADDDFEHTLDKWITGRKLSKVLELWVNGLEIEWNKFYGSTKPSRISLPTYPFARERYWINVTGGGAPVAAGASTAVLHPLVHTNTSKFNQQSYSSSFTGEEFFLKDHQISIGHNSIEKMLPAAALLEMARAAIAHASDPEQASGILELHYVEWGQPAMVRDRKQIKIALYADEDDQIDFEIFSQEDGQETVHCMGQATYSTKPLPARIDIDHLGEQMKEARIEPDALYSAFSAIGLHFGPAYQGIVSINKGEYQLLAQLSLPASVATDQNDYTLHPAMLDSALQASICLLLDLNQRLDYAILPLALEKIMVITPCTKEMYAWVRFSESNSGQDGKTAQLDIDLCDQQGNVCVQLRGLSLQEIELIASSQATHNIEFQAVSMEKPRAIQLNGSQEAISVVENTVVAKPQAIQLVSTQEMKSSFENAHVTKPEAIQLNASKVFEDIAKQQATQLHSIMHGPAVNTNGGTKVRTISGGNGSSLLFTSSKKEEPGYTREQLNEYLRTSLAEALYLDTTEIDMNKSFVDLGLDSIVGVEWMKVINKRLGLDVSATKVYDYSTISALGSFLYKELELTGFYREETANRLSPTFSE